MAFHSLWSILQVFDLCSAELKKTVYFLNMMHAFGNLPLIITNRKQFQWNFCLATGIPWIALVIAGTFILEMKKVQFYLKLVLGSILFIIFGQQLIKISLSKQEADENVPEVDLKKQWKWVAFIGVVGGLLQGLFGMSGPMAIIVLTCSPIHIKRWKGNFYAWNLPSQIFVLLKMSLGSESLFEKDKVIYYFAMCSFAILGGLFGNFLAKYLSKFGFQLIILSFCFVGAASSFTILPELKPYKGLILTIALVVDVVILSGFAIWMKKSNAKRKDVTSFEMEEKSTSGV
jgi:uncharacterized membrane protein YfcA